MSEVRAELVIRVQDTYRGILTHPDKRDEERIFGFDQNNVPYIKIGFGSQLITADRRILNEEVFLERWNQKRRVPEPGGLISLGVGIEDVADAYNRRLAYRAEHPEVLGEAVKISPGAERRPIKHDVIIWRRVELEEGQNAYLVYKSFDGREFYQDVVI